MSVKLNRHDILYFSFSHQTNDKLVSSYCHGISAQPLIGETIGQMLDKTADKYPEREAYVFCEDNSRATFKQLREEVNESCFLPSQLLRPYPMPCLSFFHCYLLVTSLLLSYPILTIAISILLYFLVTPLLPFRLLVTQKVHVLLINKRQGAKKKGRQRVSRRLGRGDRTSLEGLNNRG